MWQVIPINQFTGLNSNLDPAALRPSDAQDILNYTWDTVGVLRARPGRFIWNYVSSGLQSQYWHGDPQVIGADEEGQPRYWNDLWARVAVHLGVQVNHGYYAIGELVLEHPSGDLGTDRFLAVMARTWYTPESLAQLEVAPDGTQSDINVVNEPAQLVRLPQPSPWSTVDIGGGRILYLPRGLLLLYLSTPDDAPMPPGRGVLFIPVSPDRPRGQLSSGRPVDFRFVVGHKVYPDYHISEVPESQMVPIYAPPDWEFVAINPRFHPNYNDPLKYDIFELTCRPLMYRRTWIIPTRVSVRTPTDYVVVQPNIVVRVRENKDGSHNITPHILAPHVVSADVVRILDRTGEGEENDKNEPHPTAMALVRFEAPKIRVLPSHDAIDEQRIHDWQNEFVRGSWGDVEKKLWQRLVPVLEDMMMGSPGPASFVLCLVHTNPTEADHSIGHLWGIDSTTKRTFTNSLDPAVVHDLSQPLHLPRVEKTEGSEELAIDVYHWEDMKIDYFVYASGMVWSGDKFEHKLLEQDLYFNWLFSDQVPASKSLNRARKDSYRRWTRPAMWYYRFAWEFEDGSISVPSPPIAVDDLLWAATREDELRVPAIYEQGEYKSYGGRLVWDKTTQLPRVRSWGTLTSFVDAIFTVNNQQRPAGLKNLIEPLDTPLNKGVWWDRVRLVREYPPRFILGVGQNPQLVLFPELRPDSRIWGVLSKIKQTLFAPTHPAYSHPWIMQTILAPDRIKLHGYAGIYLRVDMESARHLRLIGMQVAGWAEFDWKDSDGQKHPRQVGLFSPIHPIGVGYPRFLLAHSLKLHWPFPGERSIDWGSQPTIAQGPLSPWMVGGTWELEPFVGPIPLGWNSYVQNWGEDWGAAHETSEIYLVLPLIGGVSSEPDWGLDDYLLRLELDYTLNSEYSYDEAQGFARCIPRSGIGHILPLPLVVGVKDDTWQVSAVAALGERVPAEVLDRLILTGVYPIPIMRDDEVMAWILDNPEQTQFYLGLPQHNCDPGRIATFLGRAGNKIAGSFWFPRPLGTGLRIEVYLPSARLTLPEQLTVPLPSAALFRSPRRGIAVPESVIPREAQRLVIFRTLPRIHNSFDPNHYSLVKRVDIPWNEQKTGLMEPGTSENVLQIDGERYLYFFDDIRYDMTDESVDIKEYDVLSSPIASLHAEHVNERVYYADFAESTRLESPDQVGSVQTVQIDGSEMGDQAQTIVVGFGSVALEDTSGNDS